MSKPTSQNQDLAALVHNTFKYLPAGNEDYVEAYPFDVQLIVGEFVFPVHGSILACNSRVFAKMLSTQKESSKCKVEGKLPIRIGDAAEDVVLMLALMYGSRISLDTALEAASMIFMGDKYDIPRFFRLAEPTLCRLEAELHFTKQHSSGEEPTTPDLLDVVPLLAIADRVGLRDLRSHCQYVILRDTISGIPQGQSTPSSDLMHSMRALEISRVNPRDLHEIVAYLIQYSSSGQQAQNTMRCTACSSINCLSHQSSNNTYYCRNCGHYSNVHQIRPHDDKNIFVAALRSFRAQDADL